MIKTLLSLSQAPFAFGALDSLAVLGTLPWIQITQRIVSQIPGGKPGLNPVLSTSFTYSFLFLDCSLHSFFGKPVGATNTHTSYLSRINIHSKVTWHIFGQYCCPCPLYVPPDSIINHYGHKGRLPCSRCLYK